MIKIAIDAGHGLYTAGKRCLKSLDSNETKEWVLNDRIADKLEQLLKSYDCQVLRTDDTTGYNDISLEERVDAANKWNADIFISLHHNAGINGGSGGGIEVYWYSSKPERKTQAEALYNSLLIETGLKGNRSTPVKKTAFYVVKNTDMPAFLCELGYMDSSTDVPIILTESYANKAAQGILNFLLSHFELKSKQSGVIYRVQCGAFKNKVLAEALRDKLKSDGYEVVIVSG